MPEPIGHILKTAREDSGLSASELAKITRIPAGSILALETGNYDVLPAPVFVRGFIRAYCREVDLDATDLLTQYDQHLHEAEIKQQQQEEEPALAPLIFAGSGEMPQRSHRGLQISHVLLLALALVTFIIAYVTAGVPSDKSTAEKAAQEGQPPATQTAASQQ